MNTVVAVARATAMVMSVGAGPAWRGRGGAVAARRTGAFGQAVAGRTTRSPGRMRSGSEDGMRSRFASSTRTQ